MTRLDSEILFPDRYTLKMASVRSSETPAKIHQLEHESTSLLRNVRNFLPVNTAQHPISQSASEVIPRFVLSPVCSLPCPQQPSSCRSVPFKLSLWIPAVWSKLIFLEIYFTYEVEEQPGRGTGRATIKPCKITCRFELDIGPGMYSGKRCRVYLDIGPIRVRMVCIVNDCRPKPCMFSSAFHSCYVPRSHHSPGPDLAICCEVQISKPRVS